MYKILFTLPGLPQPILTATPLHAVIDYGRIQLGQ